MPSTYNPGPRSLVCTGGATWDVTAVSDDGLSGFAVGRRSSSRVFWRRTEPGVLVSRGFGGTYASEHVDVHTIDTVVIDGTIWGVPGAKVNEGTVGLVHNHDPGWGALWAEANGLLHASDSVNAR